MLRGKNHRLARSKLVDSLGSKTIGLGVRDLNVLNRQITRVDHRNGVGNRLVQNIRLLIGRAARSNLLYLEVRDSLIHCGSILAVEGLTLVREGYCCRVFIACSCKDISLSNPVSCLKSHNTTRLNILKDSLTILNCHAVLGNKGDTILLTDSHGLSCGVDVLCGNGKGNGLTKSIRICGVRLSNHLISISILVRYRQGTSLIGDGIVSQLGSSLSNHCALINRALRRTNVEL